MGAARMSRAAPLNGRHIAWSSDASLAQISCLCNQLEFVRYSAGCYVLSLIVA